MAGNASATCETSVEAPTFAHALHVLSVAVGGAAQALPFVADPAEMVGVVGSVVALRNRFDALMTQFSSQMVAAGGPGSVGVRTLGQVVGAHTNADPAAFRGDDRLGRWLRDFPLFEAAFAAGEMSVSHFKLLQRHADGPRTHFVLRGDQELFVTTASRCSFTDFKQAVDYWLNHVDPDGDEPQDQEKNTGVSLHVGRGGRVKLVGEFDAVTGQAVRTAIDRAAEQLAIADKDSGVLRTESERRAAALVGMIAKGAARKDGTYSAPLINIVMSAKVAEWALEQLDAPTGEPPPVAWDDVDGRCELIDGTPIHPLLALSTFGAATFRRTILTADSRILDVSVNARAFPEWMKTALHVQARGRCETYGCDAPFRWIQADHNDPWSHSHQTRLDDGQNQCRPDNHAKGNQSGHILWRDRPRPRRQQSHGHQPGMSDRPMRH